VLAQASNGEWSWPTPTTIVRSRVMTKRCTDSMSHNADRFFSQDTMAENYIKLLIGEFRIMSVHDMEFRFNLHDQIPSSSYLLREYLCNCTARASSFFETVF
jgi:hypothetical protein